MPDRKGYGKDGKRKAAFHFPTATATTKDTQSWDTDSRGKATILASYTFKHGFSLPVRWEYISSSGNATDQAVNLMYGPGSAATSITVTPTFQRGGFFVRGDLAYVHASDITPGDAFSRNGMNQNQPRAMAEFGFMFGNNVVGKKP